MVVGNKKIDDINLGVGHLLASVLKAAPSTQKVSIGALQKNT